MKNIRSLPLFFIGLLPLADIGFAATTYSALADFSTLTNPNGVWTFGRATAANGGTFTAFDNYSLESSNSVWRDDQHISLGAPSVWRRTDLDTLNLHPGPGGGIDPFTIIRFTAPSAGNFSYSVAFTSIDNGSKGVHIYHNATSLYSSIIVSSQVVSDSDVLTLAMGDTVDVVVDPNGDYFGDSTRVSFTLEAIPEPTSALLFGMSALALAVTRRRS